MKLFVLNIETDWGDDCSDKVTLYFRLFENAQDFAVKYAKVESLDWKEIDRDHNFQAVNNSSDRLGDYNSLIDGDSVMITFTIYNDETED